MNVLTFQRVEQKYIISKEQYKKIIKLSNNRLEKDKYFESLICSIYFDTPNYDLIINSLDKPSYKEKFRLRSYGIPSIDDNIFLEVKKKYNSITNKRRLVIKLKDFYNYYNNHTALNDNQISKEMDYYFKYYNLEPKMFISYERKSYYNKYFRLTFDTNIKYRDTNLKLEQGNKGNILLENGYIMEIKTVDNIPLWFTEILNELNIYPSSYSKYGNAYKLRKEEIYV